MRALLCSIVFVSIAAAGCVQYPDSQQAEYYPSHGNTGYVLDVAPTPQPQAPPAYQPPVPQPQATHTPPQPAPPPAVTETPAPAPAAAPAAPSGGKTHTVRQGETLYGIARQHYGDGSKWTQIQEANPGISASALSVGKELIIP